MTEFSATYERKLSDGQYGSEGMSLSWTWTSDEEGPGEPVEAALAFLRKTVLTELSRSAAERVAWTASHELNAAPPRDAVPVGDIDLEDVPL